MGNKMHVIFLNYYYDSDLVSSSELRKRYSSTHFLSKAIKDAGCQRVTIVQRFSQSIKETVDGIDYYFVDDGLPNRLKLFHNPRKVNAVLSNLNPDVVHYNGFPYHLTFLRRSLSPHSATVWQHHGGGTPSLPKRPFMKKWLHTADALFFNSIEQGIAWKHAGMIEDKQPIFEIIENSSNFTPRSKQHALDRLGLAGNPVVLWVGRLIPSKDPLTVIQGFSQFQRTFPAAHLYLVYHEDTLLERSRKLANTLGMNGSIHFIGRTDHNELQYYYSAADYFVLGSHHEGSGWSLIEAIACGLPTVVTDIPPFRKITGDGKTGTLWEKGNARNFADALLHVHRNPPRRETIRSFFERTLSYDVIGAQMYAAYKNIYTNRSMKGKTNKAIPNIISRPQLAMLIPAGLNRFNEGIHIPSLYRLVESLSKEIDITVYSFNGSKNRSDQDICGKALIKHLPVKHSSHWSVKCWKLYSAIINDHKKTNYDIVHGLYGLPTEIAAIIAGKKLGIPSVISFLGGETANIPEIRYGNLRKNPDRLLTRWTIKHANLLTLLSRYQLSLLSRDLINGSHIRVIPHGVDTSIFVPFEKNWDPPFNFISVGNINPIKDHFSLLYAFEIISREFDCRLRIIGNDFSNGALRKRADELGISGRVEFTGLIPYEEMPALYRWAHILLQTSVYEGGGVAVTEAAASGVAVVGTNVGLVSDMANDKAVAVPVKDPETLAAEVLKILRNPGSVKPIREAAVDWAKVHDLSWTSNEYLRAYRELTDSSSRTELQPEKVKPLHYEHIQ